MKCPILERINTVNNLPSLPTVAMEVLGLVQAEDVAVADIAEVVQTDPALTAKILRTVNSPLFGMPRTISSLSQAMVVLGLRAVKMLVLSFSLVEALGEENGAGFDYTEYWRRSILTATAARSMALAVRSRLGEEAFVAGLLSDVGTVLAFRCVPDMYHPVLAYAATQDRPLHEIEAERLGVTHAQIGREVMVRWNMPETLCEAVSAHHGQGLEELADEARECATLVHAGTLVGELFCRDTPPTSIPEITRICGALTGIDTASLETAMHELCERVEQTACLLAVEVGRVMDYTTLQEEAAAHLVNLSVQAEVERAAASDHARQARQQAEQLQREYQSIRKVAETDGLTGIANRAAFDEHLLRELQRAHQMGSGVGLLMLDLDHFKEVNDTHGHQAGDAVLQHVAHCLARLVHDSAFVARYGGEEFAVVLGDYTAVALRRLGEEIRRTIANSPLSFEGQAIRVTASLGGALAEPKRQGATARQLIRQADKRLYLAKRRGRNRVETAGL